MAEDPLPLRPRHHTPVAGEISRTDADLPADVRRARLRTAAVAASISGTRPSSPSLVATAHGAIARLLLTIPSYAVDGGEANPYGAVYRDLIAKLPAPTELIILTHDAVADEVRGWLAAAGRTAAGRDTVVATDDFLGFSVWAEDAYVVIADGAGIGGEHAFVEPAAFPRYGDALVADQVSTAAQLGLFQAPLHLQGGNVLIGDDFFFIGIDYPLLTFEEGILTAPTQAGEDALLREVYRRYLDAERTFVPVGTTLPVPSAARRQFVLDGVTWVEEVYAGNAPGTRQPIFHIDMFVSLAGRGDDGRYRVLVGDPREAARLTGEPLQPHAMARGLRRHRPRSGPPRLRRRAHAAAARLLRRRAGPRTLVVLRDLQQRARARARRRAADRLPADLRARPVRRHARRDRPPQRRDLGGPGLRRRRARGLPPLRDQPRRGALHQEVPGARLSAGRGVRRGAPGYRPGNDPTDDRRRSSDGRKRRDRHDQPRRSSASGCRSAAASR